MLKNGLNVESFCQTCQSRSTMNFGFGDYDLADICAQSKCRRCKIVPRIDKIKFKNCAYSYKMISGSDFESTKSKRIVAINQQFPESENQVVKLEFRVEELEPDEIPEEEIVKKPKFNPSDIPNVEENSDLPEVLEDENKKHYIAPIPGISPMERVDDEDDPDGKSFHLGSMSFLNDLNDMDYPDEDPFLNMNMDFKEQSSAKKNPNLSPPLLRDQLLSSNSPSTSTILEKKEEVPKKKKILMKNEIDDSEIQILKKLGEGSYGIVYSARWNGSGGGDAVAVKEIPIMIGVEDNTRKNVMKEFQIIMDMNYRRIVRVFGYTLPPGKVRIVMDMMDGDVGVLVRKKQKLTLLDKFELLHKMTQGLNFLHSKGVIHRDVKSFNYLQRDNGREVVITDFGLALTLQQSRTHQTGKFKGTVRWMSPELMVENPRYKIGCDIYALGITYWEVLYEDVPFKNQHNDFVLMNLIKNKQLKPCLKDPTLPAPLKGLVMACLQHDEEKRPTCKELLLWFEDHRKLFQQQYNKVMKFKIMR